MEVLKLAERGHYQISTSTSIGLGQYNESIEYYDKVLAIDPNYVFVLDNKRLAIDNLG
jgi:tetratricopeptide (TPR) repeat protein